MLRVKASLILYFDRQPKRILTLRQSSFRWALPSTRYLRSPLKRMIARTTSPIVQMPVGHYWV